MQDDNLSNISKNFIKHFTKTVQALDKTVKFGKRKSKVGARIFVETLVSGCMLNHNISLESLCGLMKERGIKISKQGLDQRFNTEAMMLMQSFFLETMQRFKTERSNFFDLLKPFSSVSILDSSAISLPENLKDLYKGSGGAASQAALKIQVLFEYLSGQVNQITITGGNKNDQSYNEYLDKIEKGTLHLQDLGYFKLKSLAEIQGKGAYFISRYNYPTVILDEDNNRINLVDELEKSGLTFAKEIYLGRNREIKVRLVATRLPDEVVRERICKIKEKARKSGYQPTKEILKLAQWSIYVTNVPENMLSHEQIHLVYSLRWQIELFFKLCKSEAGIDKIRGKKQTRILCELYAKLICIIMLLYLCFPLRWMENMEISYRKAYKELSLRAIDFFRALKSRYLLMKFIKSFFNILKSFAFKDRHRKKRLLTYQMLLQAAGQEVLV